MSPEQTILMFRNREEAGYAEVYNLFFAYLVVFANRLIKEVDEAKDIAISTLESAFEKPEKFHSIEKLKAYLIISVKNKCLKYIRDEKSHRASHFEIAFISANDNNEYIEAQIIRSEFLNQVYVEIKKLPPAIRRVFEMLYIDGLNNSEVAERLNISKDIVYAYKLKAVKILRMALFK